MNSDDTVIQDKSPFRSEDGQYLTQSLFIENCYDRPQYAIYTWKRQDHELNGKKYRSFPQLYLEIADPTEYQVAITLFDGWPHWERILGNAALFVKIEALRKELEVKLQSDGIRGMIKAARGGGREAATAAKWLADRGWAPPNRPGRPSNERIKEEARRQASLQKALEGDAERLKEFMK